MREDREPSEPDNDVLEAVFGFRALLTKVYVPFPDEGA
jgi:hypothetical protein